MEDFRAVMDLWPNLVEFSEEVGAGYSLCSKWRQRNKIPSEYWMDVVKAAKRRRFRVTNDLLARIAARGNP